MLSRRDKLLVRPWIDRRFEVHRRKVECALPAIDDMKPPSRQHVAVKLKKIQCEAERIDKIQKDNFGLAQRLEMIMKKKRLDNCWNVPLPNFYPRVGLFFPRSQYESTLLVLEKDVSEAPSATKSRKEKCKACQAKIKSSKSDLELGIELPYISFTNSFHG